MLCVDEKMQAQILERRHPGRWPFIAPQRLEAVHRRHGTLAILASLDVAAGACGAPRSTSARRRELLELLQAPRARWPRGRLVIVRDNLSVHTIPKPRT